MSGTPLFWNLARASGFIAYGLLAMTMLLGLSVKTRVLGKLVKPANVVDTHRVLSLLALAMIGLHGVALVLDPVVEISPFDLAVPGMVGYRPLWVAFGIVAAYLSLVIHMSFSLRKKIGVRNWRRLHWLTYAMFVVATIHGIASGTDTTETWALAIYGVLVGAIVGGTGWRAMMARAKAAQKAAGAAPSEPAMPTPRRLGPAALLTVAFAGLAAAGVLANITLLDAARPPDGGVGSLAPLTPPTQEAEPANTAPKILTTTTTETPAKPLSSTTTTSRVVTTRPVPAPSRTGDHEGADDDD
jgi:sulfoxide reductase heme-binding subunit YedZ